MKTVIFAGGFGTRLSEETGLRPKPMVEIGGQPIITHIMGMYSRHGFNDFVVAGGYKVDYIREYFSGFPTRHQDFMVDVGAGTITRLGKSKSDWKVWVIDTGLNTMTGGRLKRLKSYVGDEPFMATYGDGVASVNISDLVAFHKSHGKLATITAVRPPARFGSLVIDGQQVVEFEEKNPLKEGWINGGFFVLEPGVLDYIDSDAQPFEKDPLHRLAQDGQLMAYQHDGFWQPMDTVRDKSVLEDLWEKGNAPWLAY
jgi:glucose-1-phosphate cytidylyltransferase